MAAVRQERPVAAPVQHEQAAPEAARATRSQQLLRDASGEVQDRVRYDDCDWDSLVRKRRRARSAPPPAKRAKHLLRTTVDDALLSAGRAALGEQRARQVLEALSEHAEACRRAAAGRNLAVLLRCAVGLPYLRGICERHGLGAAGASQLEQRTWAHLHLLLAMAQHLRATLLASEPAALDGFVDPLAQGPAAAPQRTGSRQGAHRGASAQRGTAWHLGVNVHLAPLVEVSRLALVRALAEHPLSGTLDCDEAALHADLLGAPLLRPKSAGPRAYMPSGSVARCYGNVIRTVSHH